MPQVVSFGQIAATGASYGWEKTLMDTAEFPDSFWNDPLGNFEQAVRDSYSNLASFTVIVDPELIEIGNRTQVKGECTIGTWCDFVADCIGAYCMKTPRGPHFFAVHHFCWEQGKIILTGKIAYKDSITNAVLFHLSPDGTVGKVSDFIVDARGNYMASVVVPGDVAAITDGKQTFRIRSETFPDAGCYFIYADGSFSKTNRLVNVEWNQKYKMNFEFDVSGTFPDVISKTNVSEQNSEPFYEDPFFLHNTNWSDAFQ